MDSKVDVLALLEAHLGRVVLHEVPGISRCITAEEKASHGGQETHLKIEGINMMVGDNTGIWPSHYALVNILY